ncbi:hypothetical protein Tco_0236183 [Tanacetum coccineum]
MIWSRATIATHKRRSNTYIPQLRIQTVKYIRNVGGKAYKNLTNKSYEEIRDIYEKVKRINDKFVAIGSTEDEQAIRKQDLYHLYRLVIEYYEHIPPTGLGLILHGDLTTMMEITEESDDELWRNQTEWEYILENL